MSNILIIFDVTSNLEEMREHLTTLGYLDRWFADNKTYLLPSSAMWKIGSNAEESIDEMKRAAKKLNINLKTAVAVPASPWAGISIEEFENQF